MITKKLNDNAKKIDRFLTSFLKKQKKSFLVAPMKYGVISGGKKIRSTIIFDTGKLLKIKEFKSENGPELIYASIPGPDLILNALNTKIGDKISGYVGAKVDDRFSPPILLNGTLKAINFGDKNAEVEAVVQVGSIKIIVTNKRKPYHYISDFTNLDLDPKNTDILMVKIGYLVPELYDIRGDWVMALTPGGVDQDLYRLGYKKIKRPMFPLDRDMEDPDLNAVLIPVLK